MKYAALPDSPGVYLLTHKRTGDTYVGSAKDSVRDRVKGHAGSFARGFYQSRRFLNLCEVHGFLFTCRLLQRTDANDCRIAERKWIARLNPTLNCVRRVASIQVSDSSKPAARK